MNYVLKQFDLMRWMMNAATAGIPGFGNGKTRKARRALPKMNGF